MCGLQKAFPNGCFRFMDGLYVALSGWSLKSVSFFMFFMHLKTDEDTILKKKKSLQSSLQPQVCEPPEHFNKNKSICWDVGFYVRQWTRTWRSRSEAGLIFCWNRTLRARFCCSRSKTRVRSFRHSSRRS